MSRLPRNRSWGGSYFKGLKQLTDTPNISSTSGATPEEQGNGDGGREGGGGRGGSGIPKRLKQEPDPLDGGCSEGAKVIT